MRGIGCKATMPTADVQRLAELALPDVDGLEVIARLRKRNPDIPIIVLSSRTSSRDEVAALDPGTVTLGSIPVDLDARPVTRDCEEDSDEAAH
jgi:DNA-binding response OmpR family regulator